MKEELTQELVQKLEEELQEITGCDDETIGIAMHKILLLMLQCHSLNEVTLYFLSRKYYKENEKKIMEQVP